MSLKVLIVTSVKDSIPQITKIPTTTKYFSSLTGTASNWFDRLPQVYKDDWSSFLQIFRKQFYSQKHAYHAQIEALSLVKKDNENVRHFALKVETLVKQGWYNEYPSTINLKCNEIFTRGLPKKTLPTNAKLNMFPVL